MNLIKFLNFIFFFPPPQKRGKFFWGVFFFLKILAEFWGGVLGALFKIFTNFLKPKKGGGDPFPLFPLFPQKFFPPPPFFKKKRGKKGGGFFFFGEIKGGFGGGFWGPQKGKKGVKKRGKIFWGPKKGVFLKFFFNRGNKGGPFSLFGGLF